MRKRSTKHSHRRRKGSSFEPTWVDVFVLIWAQKKAKGKKKKKKNTDTVGRRASRTSGHSNGASSRSASHMISGHKHSHQPAMRFQELSIKKKPG